MIMPLRRLVLRHVRNAMHVTRNLTSRQLVFVIFFLSMVYIYLLLMSQSASHTPSEDLKKQIIDLSEQYVKSLAQEHQDVVDGPYSGRLTGYDLKKTLAVLLQDMLERINRLESVVKNSTSLQHLIANIAANTSEPGKPGGNLNSDQLMSILLREVRDAGGSFVEDDTNQSQGEGKPVTPTGEEISENIKKKLKVLDNAGRVDFVALILGAQESCTLRPQDKAGYPECDEKIEWMRKHWKSDNCYKQMGVDGTDCSFIIYLSEVEAFCPRLPFRLNLSGNSTLIGRGAVKLNTNMSGLFDRLHNPVSGRQTYAFMKKRIERMWPQWVAAGKALHKSGIMNNHGTMRIIIHLGMLTSKSGFQIAENSFKGGPLGELVQWSDVISALYILGHEIVITSEVEELNSIINRFPSASSPCQVKQNLFIDLLYTDIIGLIQFKRKIGKGYPKFSCLLRVLDTFGTEPEYNLREYAIKHKKKSPWGGLDLFPRQFLTMYPHTPDNLFMGFVVEKPANMDSLPKKKKKIALIYGKHPSMWKDKTAFVNIINEFFEVHATVPEETLTKDNPLPDYVKNHGLLIGQDYQNLLQESTVFVGLGFPYEGPAPLEALANGVVFLNPKFDPPHGRGSHPFFSSKPTSRTLSSQHPYIEHFIGEPYSYTVDIKNTKQVKQALDKILQNPLTKGRVPHEFTEFGLLERIFIYLQHIHFCDSGSGMSNANSQTSRSSENGGIWPPASTIQFFLGVQGESCSLTCSQKKLLCEPSHMPTVNRRMDLQERGIDCFEVHYEESHLYPALATTSNNPVAKEGTKNKSSCFFQSNPLLFSCAGESNDLMRFCACRDFTTKQSAFCSKCIP